MGNATSLQVSAQIWAHNSLADTKYASNYQKCCYYVHTEAGAR